MLRKTKADIGKSPHQLFVLVCVSEIVAAVYQIIICYFTAHEHSASDADQSWHLLLNDTIAVDGAAVTEGNMTQAAAAELVYTAYAHQLYESNNVKFGVADAWTNASAL